MMMRPVWFTQASLSKLSFTSASSRCCPSPPYRRCRRWSWQGRGSLQHLRNFYKFHNFFTFPAFSGIFQKLLWNENNQLQTLWLKTFARHSDLIWKYPDWQIEVFRKNGGKMTIFWWKLTQKSVKKVPKNCRIVRKSEFGFTCSQGTNVANVSRKFGFWIFALLG